MNIVPIRSRQPIRAAWTRERLVREHAIALGQAIDNSTERNYNSALNSYLEFIRLHDLPLDPNPDTLSFFTVFMCHHIRPTSVGTYLSGICNQLEPYFPKIREFCNSALVSRTLTGCMRLLGTPTSRKRTLTVDDLLVVVTHYANSHLHDDLLFVAMLLSGFFALLRLGELTYPDQITLRDPRKVIRRASVSVTCDFYQFFLPGHKADKFFEGNIVMIPKNTLPYDPHTAFASYLTSRDNLFPFSSPLWLRTNGAIPTRSWFITRLRLFFDSSVAGQSMRAGGATSLASNGVSPLIIQAIGRWSSESFRIYIRKNPVLIQAMLFARSLHAGSPYVHDQS